MKDPTSSVRASIFEVFGKIGRFKKYRIPILPFLDGLTDLDEEVRTAAIFALEKYYDEESKALNLDEIINKIDPNNREVLRSIISLLGRLWEKNPEKILKTLLNYIKSDDENMDYGTVALNTRLINLINPNGEIKFLNPWFLTSLIAAIDDDVEIDDSPYLLAYYYIHGLRLEFRIIGPNGNYLKEGKNIITIEAYNYDNYKGAINIYGQILSQTATVSEIITDSTWLCKATKSLETNDWQKLDFKENGWKPAKSYGRPPKLNGDIFTPNLLEGEISDTQDYFGIEGYMSNFTEEYDKKKLEEMINIFNPYGN